MIRSLDQIISTVRWNSPFVVLLTYFVLKPSRPMWASSWDLPLLTSMCVWFKIIILQRPKHFQARAFDWDFEEAFIKHVLISAHTYTAVLLICMKIRFSGWESVSHTGDLPQTNEWCRSPTDLRWRNQTAKVPKDKTNMYLEFWVMTWCLLC